MQVPQRHRGRHPAPVSPLLLQLACRHPLQNSSSSVSMSSYINLLFQILTAGSCSRMRPNPLFSISSETCKEARPGLVFAEVVCRARRSDLPLSPETFLVD